MGMFCETEMPRPVIVHRGVMIRNPLRSVLHQRRRDDWPQAHAVVAMIDDELLNSVVEPRTPTAPGSCRRRVRSRRRPVRVSGAVATAD